MQNDCKTSFVCFYDRMAGRKLKCHYCGNSNGNIKKCHLAIKKSAKGENAMQKHLVGRIKFFISQEDRCVSLVAKRNRNVTPSQLQILQSLPIHIFLP